MTKTAYVYSRSSTADGMGGHTYTNTLVASVPCAIWQTMASDQISSGTVLNPYTWTMACKPDSRFAADNIVIVDGVEYRIVRPDDVMSEGDIMVLQLEKSR